MLFRPRLIRCWSTAGQSPLTESAKTRFKISHLRMDGGVLVSNNTLEPRRGCDAPATGASAPGLGGRSDGLRLEGFEPVPPFGIAAVLRKLQPQLTPTSKPAEFLHRMQCHRCVSQRPLSLALVIISTSLLGIPLFVKLIISGYAF